MMRVVWRHLILVLLLLAAFQTLARAQPRSSPDAVSTLREAFTLLLRELSAERPFADPGGALFLHVDTDGARNTPLAAMLEREGRLSFSASRAFGAVRSAEDAPFDAARPDDATLVLLDRWGVDRVMDISAELSGDRLILRARAVWLEGGSLAPLLATPFAFPERRARVSLPADPQWLLLARPDAVLGRLRLSWRSRTLASSRGRVLAIATGDLDGDGRMDMVLLFAERLELYLGRDTGLVFRQVLDLREYRPVTARARFHAGEALICEHEQGRSLAVGSSALGGGRVFRWDGLRLVSLWELAGAPVACTDTGVLSAPYREGEALPEGFVLAQRPDSDPVSLLELTGETLRLRPVAGGLSFLALSPDGRLFWEGQPAPEPEARCGAGIATAVIGGEGFMACSLPLVAPLRDSVQLFRIDGRSLAPIEQFSAQVGEIHAVAIHPHPLGVRVLAALYNPATDETTILMHDQGTD